MDFLRSLGLSWIEWLCIYTLPGLLYSTHHLYQEYRTRPSQFARDMLKAIGQEKSITERLLNIVVYIIAIAAMAFVWPAFLVWGLVKRKEEAAREIERNKPRFECSPQYLVAKVDPIDAETANYVIDPLSKTPPLPFGHLNNGWANFLSDMTDEEDEMWSFFIPKGSLCGQYRPASTGDIRGFAKVRGGEILGEFITESD